MLLLHMYWTYNFFQKSLIKYLIQMITVILIHYNEKQTIILILQSLLISYDIQKEYPNHIIRTVKCTPIQIGWA